MGALLVRSATLTVRASTALASATKRTWVSTAHCVVARWIALVTVHARKTVHASALVAGRVLAARTRLALMSAVSVASAVAANATASRASVVPIVHTRRAPTSAAATVSV